MSAVPAEDTAQPSRCWCCDQPYPDEALHHLGSHPEVGVCTDCARWLYRRATQRHDEQHPSLGGRLRRLIQSVRSAVMERGWQDRRFLGAALRWIDRAPAVIGLAVV
jgi:hypothetical protein